MRGRTLFLVAAFILCVAIAVLGGYRLGTGEVSTPPQPSGEGFVSRVVEVLDGDTIRLANGQTVRYIGIDAPETHHPTIPPEQLGQEATQLNENLVLSREVRVLPDVQTEDQYGRTLGYVYLVPEGVFVNGVLVANGLAYASTYPPNTRHQACLLLLQEQARRQKLGLWALKKREGDTSQVEREDTGGSDEP